MPNSVLKFMHSVEYSSVGLTCPYFVMIFFFYSLFWITYLQYLARNQVILIVAIFYAQISCHSLQFLSLQISSNASIWMYFVQWLTYSPVIETPKTLKAVHFHGFANRNKGFRKIKLIYFKQPPFITKVFN